MYGLSQAAILAYNYIKATLQPHGYQPIIGTTGCLCVDDFGIKYTRLQDAQYLCEVLRMEYDILLYWKAETFCKIHLKWDYTNAEVRLSMPNYV